MQSRLEYRKGVPARRRSGGTESEGAMAVEGTHGSGNVARGAREEVAWNGYNNTEEGPALFFGRQPGRAAPDGRN